MHSTLVHLNALVETRDGQKGKGATDKDRKRQRIWEVSGTSLPVS